MSAKLTAAKTPVSKDSFKSRSRLEVGGKSYDYYSLTTAEKNGLTGLSTLPFSLKVLIENLLRFEDARTVTKNNIAAAAEWSKNKGQKQTEIGFRPAAVG